MILICLTYKEIVAKFSKTAYYNLLQTYNKLKHSLLHSVFMTKTLPTTYLLQPTTTYYKMKKCNLKNINVLIFNILTLVVSSRQLSTFFKKQ